MIDINKKYRAIGGHEVRIYRELWVNVFRRSDKTEYYLVYISKDAADIDTAYLVDNACRIVCVKLVIDCEEGQGL